MEFQLPAVFRRFGEKIPLAADKGFEGSYQFLPDGVEGRVGYLGKELLEIVEQQLILFRQHRQRRIVAHRPHGLVAAGGHGRGQHPQFLVGIAKGPLPAGQFGPVGPGRRRGRRQVGQGNLVFPQPLAVGLAAGQVLFQLGIADNAPFLEADQKHPARLEAAALLDLRRGNIQYAGFRGHHQLVILGDGVAEGAQAVAIQHSADVAVGGGHNHRRPVPRLHQAGMVFVKIPLFRGHGRVLFPRLGNHHQHGVVEAAAGHSQQFQGVVKAGGVAGPRGHHRGNFFNIRPEQRRFELGFPGVHPVDIAAQGVDFPVVGQKAVGMGQFPVAQSVGAEPGMHQGKGADQGRVLQILIKAGDLMGHQQPLINQGAVGKAANIEVIGILDAQAALLDFPLNDLAEDVKFPFQGFRVLPRGAADKDLLNVGLDGAGIPAQLVRVHRHGAPAQEFQPLGGDAAVNQGAALGLGRGGRRQENHPHAVAARFGQGNAQGGRFLLKELMRQLNQDAGPVAGFRVAAASPPMAQVDQGFQALGDDLVGLAAPDVGHHAHPAAVVFQLGGVKAILGQFP